MWTKISTEMLRVYINDLGDTPDFDDCRLERVILVAAVQVLNDVKFNTDYTVNFLQQSVSPDPSTDNDFITLVSIKAACIVLGGQLRVDGCNAIKVTDGPSSIDMTNSIVGTKQIYQDLCKLYDEAKTQFALGTSLYGHAILTPYAPGNLAIRGVGWPR